MMKMTTFERISTAVCPTVVKMPPWMIFFCTSSWLAAMKNVEMHATNEMNAVVFRFAHRPGRPRFSQITSDGSEARATSSLDPR